MSKNDEICVENEELCIKNEELCIKNDEFCRRDIAPGEELLYDYSSYDELAWFEAACASSCNTVGKGVPDYERY